MRSYSNNNSTSSLVSTPKKTATKNYEAAVGELASTYGLTGTPTVTQKQKKPAIAKTSAAVSKDSQSSSNQHGGWERQPDTAIGTYLALCQPWAPSTIDTQQKKPAIAKTSAKVSKDSRSSSKQQGGWERQPDTAIGTYLALCQPWSPSTIDTQNTADTVQQGWVNPSKGFETSCGVYQASSDPPRPDSSVKHKNKPPHSSNKRGNNA